MALIHPQFDPVALDFGKIEVHWYGLMYLLAFALAYALAHYKSKKRSDFNTDMVADMIFFGAIGVIIGGRIGYVLLYDFGSFLANPLYLFKVWQGGMSFHGGFVGVLVAMMLFARKYKKAPFTVLDFLAPCVPTGLFFGRIGNFINGELWGRVSDSNLPPTLCFFHKQHEPIWHSLAPTLSLRHLPNLYQATLCCLVIQASFIKH